MFSRRPLRLYSIALVFILAAPPVAIAGDSGEPPPPIWFPDPPIKCDPVAPVKWVPFIEHEGKEAKRWKKASKRLSNDIPAAIAKDMIPLESTAEEIKNLWDDLLGPC